MSYSETHEPVSASIHFVIREGRSGFVVIFAWDKTMPGGRRLTNECGHVHRSEHAALQCAKDRTPNVEETK